MPFARHGQRPGHALEHRFDDVMGVFAAEQAYVQRHTGEIHKRAPEMAHEGCLEAADAHAG